MRNTNYTKESHTLTWTDTYMFRLVVLENLLTMNYSKTLKPNLVGAPYKRIDCNSFYYALILTGLLLKRENDHETNGFMTQQEVKCTPNNQCKCTVSNEKRGMLLREMQNFLQMTNAIIPI